MKDQWTPGLGHSLRIYRRLVGLSIRSQWQYRSSLLLSIIAQFLIISVEFLGLFLVFQRFNNFQGWTLPQLALLYGLVNMAFALADALAYGFDFMGPLLKNGDFDRLLVRPLPTIIQLLGMELTLRRAGRLLLGLSVGGWAVARLAAEGAVAGHLWWLLVPALAGGTLTFLAIFLLQAAASFFTIEGLEFMNAFSYGGQQAASYPLTAYRKFIQAIFLAFLPIGSSLYLPVCRILGKQGIAGLADWLHGLGPLTALPFAVLAWLVWQWAERHYSSAGG